MYLEDIPDGVRLETMQSSFVPITSKSSCSCSYTPRHELKETHPEMAGVAGIEHKATQCEDHKMKRISTTTPLLVGLAADSSIGVQLTPTASTTLREMIGSRPATYV